MGYTLYTDCKLFAEKNYYEAGSRKGSVVNDITNSGDASSKYPGKYSDDGSVHANGGSLANKVSTPCTWRPSSNYSYRSMTAQEAKNYTAANSGAKKSPDKMEYFCLDHNWAMEDTSEEAAVPEALIGAEYIRPACDAKTVDADLAEFTAAKNADIYAAFDSRVTTAPA